MSQNFKVMPAQESHIPFMVELSWQKRQSYEQVQPIFWKQAKESNQVQTEWFLKILGSESYLAYVAVSKPAKKLIGFIIANLIDAPPVYDPGGQTLMIDDFCVQQPIYWHDVGAALLDELEQQARNRGAVQTLVVCGAHDQAKQDLLQSRGLSIASNWFVRAL